MASCSVLPAGSGSLRAARVWIPPTMGQLKLNVDDALNVEKQLVGVGLVIQNHSWLVLGTAAHVDLQKNCNKIQYHGSSIQFTLILRRNLH
ncbi:hypothetical protein ACOSP7_009930 [Xanthoceras sorbifolium]